MDENDADEAEAEYHYFDPSLDVERPSFSIKTILASVKNRGLKETLKDKGISPHVHLMILISIAAVLAVGGLVMFSF